MKEYANAGNTHISAPVIAKIFAYTEIQVRKDLAMVSSVPGTPRTGFEIGRLIADTERALGYTEPNRAVLIGVGFLGHALLNFEGFKDYGIEITCPFDISPEKIGTVVGGRTVLDVSSLKEYCEKNKIRIGIITTPQSNAQAVCDSLVEAGVIAIWNFSLSHLAVPRGILVQNENMAANLAMLINHLKDR